MNLYDKISPIVQDNLDEFSKSIIFFDPSPVYARITIKTTSRRQSLGMSECFPTQEIGYCACGCGNKLPKRATRWFEPKHAELLVYVMKIINGDMDLIRRVLSCYCPVSCVKCGKENYTIEKLKTGYNGREYVNYSASGIHVDHIVSVKNGGGGCWLGNYQFLCHACNIQKERTDKLLRNVQPAMPLSKIF